MNQIEQSYLLCNKKIYEASFYEFVKAAWQYVDSARFQETWHIECLCVHMQALYEFKIEILDVTLPPAHAKSLIISVLFPVWCWIKNPSIRLGTGSHEMGLAIRDTLKSRYLIQCPWFQQNWGDVFVLTSDQNTKGNYLNDKRGYRIAISTGAGTTGNRFDIILFDDAMSVAQADSEPDIIRVNDYMRQTLYNRQDVLSKTRMAIIGQRVGHKDYHSIFLPLPNCVHVNLPLEYEPENSFSSEFYKDPRTQPNEILWKIPKFEGEQLRALKEMMGKRGYETQYQQRTSVQEGEMLKREYWKFYRKEDLPTYGRVISAWDFAAKTKKRNDFTVGITGKKVGAVFYILNVYRKRVEFPQAKRDFTEQSDLYNPLKIYIEDASNGTPLISEMKSVARFVNRITPVSAHGNDKMAKVLPVTPIIEGGNVLLPENAPWLDIFIEECANFPNGEHDDLCFVAGTKVATLFGSKNIEDVKYGDRVITPFGIGKVLKSECTGIKEVIWYKNTLVTKNHPFFTRENGFIRADALTIRMSNDIISLRGLILWRYKKLLYLMENNIDLWGREGIILANQQQMKEEGMPKDCMLRFMNFIVEKKYKKAMLFIIKMAIILITTIAIWNVFQSVSIWNYIVKKEKVKSPRKNTSSISQESEKKPPYGTEAKRGVLGIESTRKYLWGKSKSRNIVAKIVTKILKAGIRQKILKKDFARLRVGRTIAIRVKAKPYKERVVFVLNYLKKIFLVETKAEKRAEEHVQENLIGKTEKQKVYNITIEKHGVYYANKFLVSNCDALAILLNNERATFIPQIAVVKYR